MELGAVCWQQPTGLMGHVGRSLGLYVGNLQVLWGLDGACGCMLATYSPYGACWTELGAVCWQPTGMLDGAWGCMLAATYRSYGACWTELGAVCWQQLFWGMVDRAWGCMLATYSSYGGWWTELGAVCWQPTALMGHVGRSLGLYVGNLQLLWGMLDGVWGCMLATYSSYGACWTELGAVCWQPTALMGHVGRSLGLYVGNLLGAVCWQPTALMGHVGRSLGLYVGNLGAWGCMLVTFTLRPFIFSNAQDKQKSI